MQSQTVREHTILDTIESGKSLMRYLLRKWYIILLVLLVFGLLGILYAWLQKPQYRAVLTFSTESSGASQLGAYAGIAAQFGLDIGGGSNNAFEGGNLIELLRSRNLIERTLLTPIEAGRNELLVDQFVRSQKMREGWREEKLKNLRFVPYPSPADRTRDSVISIIYKNIIKGKLNIGKTDKKLDIIEISLMDGDELFAKRFVELLTENAIEYYTNYKVGKTRQNVKILQRQTDSIRHTLFGNITQVAAINDLNVNPVRQVVRTGSQKKQVDVQVNAALYEELLKNLELSKLSLRRETPLIQIIDSPKYPLEKKKLGRLLGGIIFAFIGGFLVIAYLLVGYWLRALRTQSSTTVYQ